jgi:predicted Zn-dependent peptidase
MKEDHSDPIILPNGLTAYVQQTPTPTVFVKLRVHCGTFDEVPGEEGVAHFVEHALMNGGTEVHSPAQQLNFRRSLPYANAYTTRLRTTYEAAVYPRQLAGFLEYLGALLFLPRFDRERIEQERRRILCEIADCESTPWFSSNRSYLNALTSSEACSRSVLGAAGAVSRMSIAELKNFHQQTYCATNCDVFIVGNIPDDCVHLLVRTLGKWPAGQRRDRQLPAVSPPAVGIRLVSPAPDLINPIDNDASSAAIRLGVIATPATASEEAALRITCHLLGNRASGFLRHTLGHGQGLCYDVVARYDTTNHFSHVRIDAKIAAAELERSVDSIFEAISSFSQQRRTNEDLAHAKAATKYQVSNAMMRSNTDVNEGFVRALEQAIDSGVALDERLEHIDAVTLEAVERVIEKHIRFTADSGRYVLLIRNPFLT